MALVLNKVLLEQSQAIHLASCVAAFPAQRQSWVIATETIHPQALCRSLLSTACSICLSLSTFPPPLWVPPSLPPVLPCVLCTMWPQDWIVLIFSLSGTRSQITTCSHHMFSIVRGTQISPSTFFTLNLYGSFGTSSRRTPRRRFSPTHHLLASLVGALVKLERVVCRQVRPDRQ